MVNLKGHHGVANKRREELLGIHEKETWQSISALRNARTFNLKVFLNFPSPLFFRYAPEFYRSRLIQLKTLEFESSVVDVFGCELSKENLIQN